GQGDPFATTEAAEAFDVSDVSPQPTDTEPNARTSKPTKYFITQLLAAFVEGRARHCNARSRVICLVSPRHEEGLWATSRKFGCKGDPPWWRLPWDTRRCPMAPPRRAHRPSPPRSRRADAPSLFADGSAHAVTFESETVIAAAHGRPPCRGQRGS